MARSRAGNGVNEDALLPKTVGFKRQKQAESRAKARVRALPCSLRQSSLTNALNASVPLQAEEPEAVGSARWAHASVRRLVHGHRSPQVDVPAQAVLRLDGAPCSLQGSEVTSLLL